MKNTFLFFQLLIFGGLMNVSLLGQTLYREIERIILHDTDISYELTPGFIVGIIDGYSTYIESYGSVANNRKVKLTEYDLFEVGSISKMFTSSLMDIAATEGIISFDDKVNQFLPLDYQNPRMETLTIGDLVNHQSGLPKRPFGFGEKELDAQNPYFYYTKLDLLEAYSIFVPDRDESVYSHMNYALLEIILEEIYSLPFAEILKNKILEPLEMKETFIHLKEDKNVLTAGLDRSGTQVKPWEFSSFAGSEGVKTSLQDLLKFLRANLNLEASSLATIWNDNFDDDHTSFNEQIAVSNGWQIFKISKRLKAVLHTGLTSGHSAFIGMVRETGTGVIVLSNSTFGTRDLGMLILRMVNHNWKRKPNQ